MRAICVLFCMLWASTTQALTITKMFDGLDQPWALGFLPDGSVLVTERDGRLLRQDGDTRHNVAGVPEVYAQGQGGLLDLLVLS